MFVVIKHHEFGCEDRKKKSRINQNVILVRRWDIWSDCQWFSWILWSLMEPNSKWGYKGFELGWTEKSNWDLTRKYLDLHLEKEKQADFGISRGYRNKLRGSL